MRHDSGAADERGVLLETRLRPPALRPATVLRGDLLDRLDRARDQRLIEIAAATGYGKTTLLVQWMARCRARGERVAWLSVDDEDLSPGKLVDYCARAIADTGVGAIAPGWSHADGGEARERLRRLVNLVARDAAPLILIVDDVDALHADGLREMLALLLRWAPDNLLLALSGRGTIDLPSATLHVQGLATRIGAAELQFGLHDVLAMPGLSPERREAGAILERTQGWPAMIGLLHGLQRDPAGDFTHLSARYLSEQVLAALDDPARDALIGLSLLDRIDAAAVVAMCGEAGAVLWDGLRRRSAFEAFLPPAPGDDQARRLHPILHAALREAFDALPPEAQRGWHARAAAWRHQQGHLVASIDHAIRAGESEQAARYIVAAGATRLWIEQGRAQIAAIDALLDARMLEVAPRLKLLRALVLIKRGALIDAETMFTAAKAQLGDPAGLDSDTRFDLLLVESTLLFNQCSPSGDEYLSLYAQRMEELHPAGDAMLGNVQTLMSLSLQQRGMPARALACAQDAEVHYARAQLRHGSFFVEFYRAAAHFAMGDSAAADAALDHAAVLTKRYLAEDDDKTLLVAIARAEIAADAGRFALAARRLDKSLRRLPEMEAWHAIHAATIGTIVAIDLAQGDSDAAHRTLDTAFAQTRERGLSGLLPYLTAQRMICLVRAGAVREARVIAATAGLTPDPYCCDLGGEGLWREREAVLTAFGLIALAEGDHAAVIAMIERPLADWRGARLSRPRLQLHLLGALACDRGGDVAAARGHLMEALDLAKRSGHVRAFAAEGAALLDLLERHVDFVPLARGMLATLRANAPVRDAPLFTARETDVLAGLAEGLSAKRIARTLTLTENTVKFHLKNIYGKLRVHNRTAAVAQARMLAQSGQNSLQ